MKETDAVAGNVPTRNSFVSLERRGAAFVLRLHARDGANKLTRGFLREVAEAVRQLAAEKRALIITGNETFFSAGADLKEIAALNAPTAYEFSKMGQELMSAIDNFPAPVYAAVGGYCMGGGLDLALACHRRMAAPHAVFGHRGAALGLITGWGGTQRLPRLIGKARALEMFVAAEKISAERALQIGLVDGIATDPVSEALRRIAQ